MILAMMLVLIFFVKADRLLQIISYQSQDNKKERNGKKDLRNTKLWVKKLLKIRYFSKDKLSP